MSVFMWVCCGLFLGISFSFELRMLSVLVICFEVSRFLFV